MQHGEVSSKLIELKSNNGTISDEAKGLITESQFMRKVNQKM